MWRYLVLVGPYHLSMLPSESVLGSDQRPLPSGGSRRTISAAAKRTNISVKLKHIKEESSSPQCSNNKAGRQIPATTIPFHSSASMFIRLAKQIGVDACKPLEN